MYLIDTECCIGDVMFVLSLDHGVTITFTESPNGSQILSDS